MINKFIKKIGYKVLHLITMGQGVPARINGFTLKLPTRYFRLFGPDYEQSSFNFFKSNVRPGGVTLDIGAHIGLYSVFFAKTYGGKVYSFEPTPSTVEVLRKTVAINKCEKTIEVVEAAVSERPGSATFYSNEVEVSTSNSLVDLKLTDTANRSGAYDVVVTSIDHFRAANNLKIDVLKIDSEGVEIEVLKGARNTFLEDKPIGILGLHPFAYNNRADRLSDIWEILMEYNLKVQFEGNDITKEVFCNKKDHVFDIEFLQH